MDTDKLREKIKEVLYAAGCPHSLLELECDKIVALFPDIEELDKIRNKITELNKKLDDREEDLIKAKRETEERIKIELSGFVEMLRRAPEMHGDIQSDPLKTQEFLIWWQALKGGK